MTNDSHTFELLSKHVLPSMGPLKTTPFRVWFAECSSGVNAYAMGICIKEYIKAHEPDFSLGMEVVGTSDSQLALQQAESAEYRKTEWAFVLNSSQQQQYLQDSADGKVRIVDTLRGCFQFHKLNLLQSYAALGQFDIVFLQGALLTFSRRHRVDIVARVTNILNPLGYLVVNDNDPVTAYSEAFEEVDAATHILYHLKR